MRPVVAIAMPTRNGTAQVEAVCAVTVTATGRDVGKIFMSEGISLLTHNFNRMFVKALNMQAEYGVTHFAMLHDDVVPDADQFWLDVLVDELDAAGADLVSAVVPMKHRKRLTSTGACSPQDLWHVRRLSMREVLSLPETFTADDLPAVGAAPGSLLLANTGCWVMKLGPWVKECGLTFRQQDRIVFDRSRGHLVAEAISEDWDFSQQLAAAGRRVAVTRKVRLSHEKPEYHNRDAADDEREWGTDETYLATRERLAGPAD